MSGRKLVWIGRIIAAVSLVLAAGCGDPGDGVGPDGGGVVDDPQAFLFDESVIRTYEVEVDEADWEWLNENEQLEEYVPAVLHFEDEVVEQVAIRYKGNFGSLHSCFDGAGNRICPKLSIKLKFSEYDDDQKFHGLKRLNFHSMYRDPAQMRDAIAYKLFRDNGVPASRTAYAKLIVNGEYLGLFAVVEQVDGRFTRVRFPDGGKGNIYKEVWPVHEQEQPYIEALKSNRNEDPTAEKMVRFAAALRGATDETFEQVIEEWTDAEALMRYNAVARAIDHWDDIVGWYCVGNEPCFNHNYYWYESTEEDRLWLVAWDLDNTFQEPSPIRTYYNMPDWDETDVACDPIPVFFGIGGMPPACDDFLRRMATVTWDRYVAATEELLDGDFRVEALHARIDELEALIEDEVAADPNGPGLSTWQSEVDSLREAIEAKHDYIAEKIGR